ncbi:SH3 domain-containing protein [Oceanobacillus sp. Castelsardo]|uniref:SH3 domain-containing protein n=1 Tax=Oceanobacillus sp. Castelsardo TaxID=1851204 RepID=UPI000838E590|nr:SH3 domain-containing protein [Oceanobacillus sp. Castelsardo]
MAEATQVQYSELDGIIDRLQDKLARNVWEELQAFVEKKVEEKFHGIYVSLDKRYALLKAEVYERISDESEQVDPMEIQRRLFEIANPREMHTDLQEALQFNEIGPEYEDFLFRIQEDTYGHLFQPLILQQEAYQQLERKIFEESNQAYLALNNYAKQMKAYVDIVKKERESKGFHFFTKLVAKGIGLVAFGPFGSIGAGVFMNALYAEGSNARQAMTNLEEALFFFLDELDEALEKMKAAYTYVLFALYGGCFQKVNEVLEKYNIELNDLNLLTYEFTVKYTGKEETNFTLWAERQNYIIERSIRDEKWDEARVLTDRFYHYVKNQPGAFPIVLQNGRSVYRQSYLLKYIVISKIAETRGKWIGFVQEMFKQLPYMVRKKEVEDYDVKSPVEWGMLLIQQAIKKKDPSILKPYLDYTCKLVKRRQNAWKVPVGEELVEGELDWNTLLGYITVDFLSDKWKEEHPLQTYTKDASYEKDWLQGLRKWYIELTGRKDSLTRYISLLIFGIHVGNVVRPIVNICKKSGKKLHSYRKPIMKVSLSGAVALTVIFGGYQLKDEAIGFISSFGSEQEMGGKVAASDVEADVETLTIQVDDGANVRDYYSLDGNVLFTLAKGTEVHWKGEEVFGDDASGKWYYIQAENGEGWINEIVLEPSSVVEDDLTDIEEPVPSDVQSVVETDVYESNGSMEEFVSSVSEDSTDIYENDMEPVLEPEIESTNEDDVYDGPTYRRHQAVEFSSYIATLDERIDMEVDEPYSLYILEETPEVDYVRSVETLYEKPQEIWASNIEGETYQLVAVSYENLNEIDIFVVNPEGMIDSRETIAISDFYEVPEGFKYADAYTDEEMVLTVEAGVMVERNATY